MATADLKLTVQLDPRLLQAVACLEDAEQALRMGNTHGAVKAIFIWSQRGDRILAGEETWADQRFDPVDFGLGTPTHPNHPGDHQ